jgi:hypothetical protein
VRSFGQKYRKQHEYTGPLATLLGANYPPGPSLGAGQARQRRIHTAGRSGPEARMNRIRANKQRTAVLFGPRENGRCKSRQVDGVGSFRHLAEEIV